MSNQSSRNFTNYNYEGIMLFYEIRFDEHCKYVPINTTDLDARKAAKMVA